MIMGSGNASKKSRAQVRKTLKDVKKSAMGVPNNTGKQKIWALKGPS